MMSTNKVLTLSGVLILLTISLEIIFVHPHVYYWWHGFIGFDAIFGFLGCLLLVGIVKGPIQYLIQREEGYYGGGEKRND
jgi:hypothetical protein